MPKRKANVVPIQGGVARGAAGGVTIDGYLTSHICLKRELDELNRGKGGLVCACPLCQPAAWCVAVLQADAICAHPRHCAGEAKHYPFCYRHYKMLVDTYPAPAPKVLAAFRAWKLACDKKGKTLPGGIKLASEAEIYSARLVREEEDAATMPLAVTKKFVSRLARVAPVGGAKCSVK